MTAPTELPIDLQLPLDVPDADAVEQARQVRPVDPPEPSHVHDGPEADEYDAVQQGLEVVDDEDEYR
jgi:hypothetical protein